ncbi:ubiquitin carboxyl-terminal hydrolase 5/13 [Nematocida sp. AWRm77]|nr:ubiquitin carboxyl-terminal hydrolase 5/13 [Nematocida sp. AWRm77]
MFDFGEFTGECSFCYRRVPDGVLSFCECGTSMCAEHLQHTSSGHMAVDISVTGETQSPRVEISTYGADLGPGTDVDTATEAVREAITNPFYAGVQRSLKACAHVPEEGVPLEVGSRKCAACSVDNNTWMCVCCGECLCGREQYGIEGNGHAKAHFEKDSAHAAYVKVQSINTKRKTCDVYCYLCDRMVQSQRVYKRLSVLHTPNEEGLSTLEIEKNLNAEAGKESIAQSRALKYHVLRSTGGIPDLGSTCYLGSVLQVLGECVEKWPGVLEYAHGDACAVCVECPLRCFGCQLKKVLVQVGASHRERTSSFCIRPFWKTFHALYPQYVLDKQHDAVEALESLLGSVQEMDAFGHFQSLCAQFTGEVSATLRCTACSRTTTGSTQQSVLYLGERQSISDTFQPEDVEYTCECGSVRAVKTSVLSQAPSVLLVAIKRGMGETSEQSQEILLSIHVPTKEGLSARYTLSSVIVHEGTVQAGHYMVQVSPGTSKTLWKVYDEESVGESPLLSSNVVLMLYTKEASSSEESISK